MLNSCQTLTQATPDTTTAEVRTFTVTFHDYDGTVLATRKVVYGQAAAAPEDPDKEGGRFVGWDKNFSCVTEDMTVTAQYAWTVRPTVMVSNMTVKPGQIIKLPVSIVNNPGVAGAKITMIYDPAITLKDSESGEAFSVLDYTQPGKYMSPCSFTWDSEKGMAKNDGTILWLTFEIPSNAPKGKIYTVKCVCKDGDTYNEDLADVFFEVINGTITVE